METRGRSILLNFYADSSKCLAISLCQCIVEIQQFFPHNHLRYFVTQDGHVSEIQNIGELMANSIEINTFPIICDGDALDPVYLTWYIIPRELCPKGLELIHMNLEFPARLLDRFLIIDLLLKIGHCFGALYGMANSHDTASILGSQIISKHLIASNLRSPLFDLPVLKPLHERSNPCLPISIGWINYWSQATARALRFPNKFLNESFFFSTCVDSTGAWILCLSSDVLDLRNNESHLNLLRDIYNSFFTAVDENNDY